MVPATSVAFFLLLAYKGIGWVFYANRGLGWTEDGIAEGFCQREEMMGDVVSVGLGEARRLGTLMVAWSIEFPRIFGRYSSCETLITAR